MAFAVAKTDAEGVTFFLKQDTVKDAEDWREEAVTFRQGFDPVADGGLTADDVTLFHNKKSARWWIKKAIKKSADHIYVIKVDVLYPPITQKDWQSECCPNHVPFIEEDS